MKKDYQDDDCITPNEFELYSLSDMKKEYISQFYETAT